MREVARRSYRKVRRDGLLAFVRSAYARVGDNAPFLPAVVRRKYVVPTSEGDIALEVRSLEESRRVTFREHGMLDVWIRNIRPGDAVWDVGAGFGVYTVAAAYVSDRVVGFEPNPGNYARVEETIRHNDTDADVFEFALGKRTTAAELSVERSSTGTRTEFCEHGPVDVYRGDELDSIPDPDVIKIDVEGSEVEVIDGMAGLLDTVRFLLIEVHGGRHDIESRGHDKEEFLDRIEQFGFDIEVVVQAEAGNEHWICRRE